MRKKVGILWLLCLFCVGCKPDLIRKGAPATVQTFQLGNVHHVVKKVQQHFPNVALSHLYVTYDYSVLNKTKTLAVLKLSFYLPYGKVSLKQVKKHVRVLMHDLGHKDLSCLNVFLDSNRRRFVGYKTPLQEVKVYFACG